MQSNSARRRIAVVASTVLIFGAAAVACGEDVVDDDVEEEINEIDNSIEDFVDTMFTEDNTTTTGG